MDRIDATSTSYAARIMEGSNGALLHCHRRGSYLKFGGGLILICGSQYGYIPFGVAVGSYERMMGALSGHVGAPCWFRGGTLVIPAAGVQMDITYRACPPVGGKPQLDTAVSALLGTERGALKSLAVSCPETRYSAYAAPYAEELLRATARSSHAGMCRALERLIGLGPGLSPAADDWLCGLIYTLHRGDEWASSHAEGLAEAVEKKLPGRTTGVSEALLKAVVAGERFEALDRALYGQTVESFRMLLSVGSSSGADMLTGIVSALKFEKLAMAASMPAQIIAKPRR